MLNVELPSGATVEDLYDRLAANAPELGGALASAVAVIEGQHVGRDRTLSGGQEVALLTPVAGG
ncbi:MAG TPA: MoaD/ThiS family protein [Solirubrobacteraceae bacterium]|nr:MoaD/ThiS family protein [Solirubrobacteraceae bacterium]